MRPWLRERGCGVLNDEHAGNWPACLYNRYVSEFKYYHATILPCYHTTILPYYHTIMLPCYHANMLPCYRTTILPYYHTIMLLCYPTTLLPYYHATMLPYYRTIMLLCYHTTILPYYHATILPYYHTNACRRTCRRWGGRVPKGSCARYVTTFHCAWSKYAKRPSSMPSMVAI
jgi:hypothetical protein